MVWVTRKGKNVNVKLSEMTKKERADYEAAKTDKNVAKKLQDKKRDASMAKQMSKRLEEKATFKKDPVPVGGRRRTYEYKGMVLNLGGSLPALSPEDIIEKAIAYFEWNDDNPIETEEHATFRGYAHAYNVNKARPLTITRCVLFLGICYETWKNYKLREPKQQAAIEAAHAQGVDYEGALDGAEYTAVCEWVEGIIRSQKFEGAAAGIFNPMIICRELGLKDNTKVVTDDGEGGDAPVNGAPVVFLPQNGREAGNFVEGADDDN